jgi:hypothetical protein
MFLHLKPRENGCGQVEKIYAQTAQLAPGLKVGRQTGIKIVQLTVKKNYLWVIAHTVCNLLLYKFSRLS